LPDDRSGFDCGCTAYSQGTGLRDLAVSRKPHLRLSYFKCAPNNFFAFAGRPVLRARQVLRWDEPPRESDRLETLEKILQAIESGRHSPLIAEQPQSRRGAVDGSQR
jgi:hypothetical protein